MNHRHLAECQRCRIIDGNRKLSGITGMVDRCWQVLHISVHSTGKRRAGFPLSRQQFYYLLTRISHKAGLPVCAHPHMLRHACGYALADNGADTRLIQDYLGHRN
ncbi:hypothetical protein EKO40_16820, partial [Salmonella enterica]|nr:hypothetical protein [Salmonella enterica]